MIQDSLILLNQDDSIFQEVTFLNEPSAPYKLFNNKPFCIAVTPDKNRLLGFLADPYFKLGTANDLGPKCKGVIRVYFKHNPPEILYHLDKDDPKRGIVVNSRIRKDLNKALIETAGTYIACNGEGYSSCILNCINRYLEDVASEEHLSYEWVNPEFVNLKNLVGYIPNMYGQDVFLC